MFKNISSIIKDSIGNIIYRGNVVTGTVAVVRGDGSYDVFISESDIAYPKIFTLSANPDLAVGDKVRILYKNGCKELPIILPPVITVIPGDLIICCFHFGLMLFYSILLMLRLVLFLLLYYFEVTRILLSFISPILSVYSKIRT